MHRIGLKLLNRVIKSGNIKVTLQERPKGYNYWEVVGNNYIASIHPNSNLYELRIIDDEHRSKPKHLRVSSDYSVVYAGYHDNDKHRKHIHLFIAELYGLLLEGAENAT